MTATVPEHAPTTHRAGERRLAEIGATARQLRLILRTNAAFSLLSGVVAIVAAEPVSELLGVDVSWLVRLVGVGLVGFAGGVLLIARAAPGRLHASALLVSAADFGWVAATAVVIAGGWLAGGGVAMLGVVALVVAAFGIEQLIARHRLGRALA